MGDLVAGLRLGDTGPWAIVTLIVLLVLAGRLVTRQQLLDTRADRDHWRSAHDTQQQIALTHGMTLERLLSLAETSEHALTQIQAGLQYRPEER